MIGVDKQVFGRRAGYFRGELCLRLFSCPVPAFARNFWAFFFIYDVQVKLNFRYWLLYGHFEIEKNARLLECLKAATGSLRNYTVPNSALQENVRYLQCRSHRMKGDQNLLVT